MKAAQINEYGDANVLKTVDDAPMPKVDRGQVLVEVYAAAVNPFDWKVRQGYMKDALPLNFPATLGGDFAGKITEVGEDVTGFKTGQEVFGQANAAGGQGSYAEFTPVKAESLAPKPKTADFITAAALPLAGVSAYQALVENAGLKAGQKVLVHGGAGGIGSFAIQLAKHLGATVASTAEAADLEFVKQLGADEAIDYKSQDFSALLSDYDVVYDTVGGETFKKSHLVLKPGGVIVSMLEQPNEELMKQHEVKDIYQFTQVTTERLSKLAELVDQGAIKVSIDKTFPLEQAGEAQAYLQAGRHNGKVVLQVK